MVKITLECEKCGTKTAAPLKVSKVPGRTFITVTCRACGKEETIISY